MATEDKEGTIKVARKEQAEKATDTGQAAYRLIDSMVNTPDNRMGEMTFLPRTLAFLLSIQHCMNPKLIYDEDVDIVDEWELTYMKYLRSVGGDHIDRVAKLAEIEMAGGTEDDEEGLGSGQ